MVYDNEIIIKNIINTVIKHFSLLPIFPQQQSLVNLSFKTIEFCIETKC